MDIKSHCYAIGLTGGIASGKSAVSEMFEKYGSAVIDADLIAREVVKAGSEGLKKLVLAFGSAILMSDGKLNRSGLRKVVFNDKNKLTQLNSILHPLIEQQIINQMMLVKDNFCVVVIPLLCESSQYKWLDRVLVVDIKPEVQLQRLMERDAITDELAQKMIASQCSRKQRLLIADDVIKNEKSLIELKNNVDSLHNLYKQFIKSKKNMHFD